MAVRYTVNATRSGRWWALSSPQVPGALSQVARLDQVEDFREAIAFVAGVPIESVELDVVPVLPEAYVTHQREAARQREAATSANAAAAREARQAARVLVEAGLTRRDVATILGVSPQRAHQLVAG